VRRGEGGKGGKKIVKVIPWDLLFCLVRLRSESQCKSVKGEKKSSEGRGGKKGNPGEQFAHRSPERALVSIPPEDSKKKGARGKGKKRGEENVNVPDVSVGLSASVHR